MKTKLSERITRGTANITEEKCSPKSPYLESRSIEVNGWFVAEVMGNAGEEEIIPTKESLANAELIKETWDVTQETGLSPRELKGQSAALIADCQRLIDNVILRTATGDQRDRLTELNIRVLDFLNKVKP